MSDSMRPHRWQPTRLPHPWDSPGKNTGVGCHFLLQCRKVKSESEVAQSCPTLSDPMDCSPPGSSVHGIFQARVLEWGAISMSRKMQESGLLKSVLWCAPQLSGLVYSAFSSWVSSGTPLGVAAVWWFNGCSILCLLIWQATFFHWEASKN